MDRKSIHRFLKKLPSLFLFILVYIITLRWLTDIIQLISDRRDVSSRRKYLMDVRKGQPVLCAPICIAIGSDVYKRADPLIYSQRYLLEQGLAVTWDNPDIQLFKNGIPVSSSSLEADTQYEVVATIYNNSTEAPAVGLPVEFSFLSFGVGTVKTPIGVTTVNLPVKGSPNHPAKATHTWTTPKQAGHYCLQVDLKWEDDANPRNNLGQENTNVVSLASPAVFEFPVRNEDTIRKLIHMVVDTYVIPEQIDCEEKPNKKESDRKASKYKRLNVFIPPLEEEADWTFARKRHGAEAFPIPQGWQVTIEPEKMLLERDQQQTVKVTISAPPGFEGSKTFNINALHGNALIGGVTVTVTTQKIPSQGKSILVTAKEVE